MNPLSKRLAKLEGEPCDGAAVLILSIPGDGGEFNLVKDAAGQRVMRRADESEDSFLARARRELMSTQVGQAGGATSLWVLRDIHEEHLAEKHAEQLGAGLTPLRPTVSRDEWLRLHGINPVQLER
jgi:hypothetical protein